MIEWNKLEKQEIAIIQRIAKRADRMLREVGNNRGVCNISMDISAGHLNIPLKLEELEKAEDFDFMHDVCGIIRHLNRDSGEIENCFLPRYAKPKRDRVHA